MKQKINPWIVIVGIICLTLIEGMALYKGIDGVYLTIVVAVIAAAIGATIPLDKIIK